MDDEIDDEEIDALFDGHSIHDEHPSLEIVGVICVCICGKRFIACIGCLLNGNVESCPDCNDRLFKAHLN